jgi:hypothetical protein
MFSCIIWAFSFPDILSSVITFFRGILCIYCYILLLKAFKLSIVCLTAAESFSRKLGSDGSFWLLWEEYRAGDE